MRLSFKTGGIVDAVFADEGQSVEKGRLLARLDLSEIEAQAEQARAAYDKALRDLQRIERLYEKDVTTLEQLQNARTALEIARSDREIAEFNLRHSSIYAPTDGKILGRFVESGELVASGTPVFLFASGTSDWVMRVGVADHQVVRMNLGDPASVLFDPYPDSPFEAQVTEIAETANPASGLFEVELRLDTSDRELVSGFIGRARITPETQQPFVMVPVEALVEGEGLTGSVLVVENAGSGEQARTAGGSEQGHSAAGRTVRRVTVAIERILGEEMAVSQGLSGGELVVVEGPEYLADGAPVRVAGGDSK
jgi:RND family efflux transporter MFP subunit